jgi:hypothetical protein
VPGGRLAADELQEDSMLEDTDQSADKRTDTESDLLERGAPSRDVAEPRDEEGGSAHPPGYHEPAERSSAGDIARRERNPERGEG